MKFKLKHLALPLLMFSGVIFGNEEIHRELNLTTSNQELGQILHQAEQVLVAEGYRQHGPMAVENSGGKFKGEVMFRRPVPESAHFDAKIVVRGRVQITDEKTVYTLIGVSVDREFGTRE